MQLLRPSHKRHPSFFLVISRISLGEASCHVVKASRQTYEMVHLVKNWSFLPTALVSFAGGADCKESARNAGDPGSIPGSGRSPEEGSDSPLQYSCPENSMDRGACRAIIHGVTKSRTWLNNYHSNQQQASIPGHVVGVSHLETDPIAFRCL